MNALTTISAVELALLRAEAAKAELNSTFERLHGREITEADDERLSVASDAWERAEAELRRVASEALGVDPQRLCDVIS